MPAPVLAAVVAIAAMWLFMTRMRTGAHIYAVGGAIEAAGLSGVDAERTLILAYGVCALIASSTGLLLTARLGSGEANPGGAIALDSIAACGVAGVSLRDGVGRVETVVLGAFLILPARNAMNPAPVGSSMQMVLRAGLLILAVVFDQVRDRMMMGRT